MAKAGSNLPLQVIVVGSSADQFVRHTINLLGDCGIKFVLCDDVYSAVGELAKTETENALVVGRLGQLSPEQGRLFHMACEKGYTCCCLADVDLVRKRKQIFTAIETGAFIINEPAEIREVVTKLLAGSGNCSPGKKGNDRATATIKAEFLTTKAELDALLGV
ncbi:MAG: hypothetical protein ACYST5_07540 [Planctomycetota bacterium]